LSDFNISDMVRNDFDRAYFNSLIIRLFRKFRGKSSSLLSYNEIMQYIKIKNETYKGMQIVPINDIIGSEGRYNDFDKQFLPKNKSVRTRWESIDSAHYHNVNLPSIRLYQIGKIYFVRDGNHRVSVARRQGREFIDAEVTEVRTDVEITVDTTKEELRNIIIGKEFENFLEITELDKYRDVSMFNFSSPGRFDEILNHINGHQYFMGIERKASIQYNEAVLSWYDNIFMPIINEIEDEGILFNFSGRTAADLYLWIVRHWDDLKRQKGPGVKISHAVKSYKDNYGESTFTSIKKWFINLFKI
jgi:hypothetical protein